MKDRKDKLTLTFVNKYDTLFRLVYAYIKTQDETSDILQEAYLHAYSQNWRSVPEKNMFSWLVVICKNAALDALRNKREFCSTDDLPDSKLCYNQEFNEDLTLQAVALCLIAVPEDVRRALYDILINDIRAVDASRKHNVTISKIRYWQNRVKNDIYDLIK